MRQFIAGVQFQPALQARYRSLLSRCRRMSAGQSLERRPRQALDAGPLARQPGLKVLADDGNLLQQRAGVE